MKISQIEGEKMRYSDSYKWTVNVSIGSPFGAFIRVWIGDVNWTWESKRPLKVVRIDTEAVRIAGQQKMEKAIAEVLKVVEKQEPPR